MTVPPPPTYLDGIHDAIAVVDRQSIHANDPMFAKLLTSELRSLSPQSRDHHRATREQNLETIVNDFAARIVAAAVADIEYSNQRYDSNGNVCATVSLSFPETCRWLRYEALRKNPTAIRVLDYIAAQRSPGHPAATRAGTREKK